MTRTRLGLVLLATFTAGVTIGAAVAAWIYDKHLLSRQTSVAAAAAMGGKLATLNALRSANPTNAVAILESGLDADLVTIALLPVSAIDPVAVKLVERAATYRAKYPRKIEDPAIEKVIAELFARRRTQ